jgi:transposase-like protein
MRNLLAKVPRSAGPFVATLVRSIFAQPDAEAVWAQFHRVVDQLTERFPDAAAMLEAAGTDILAFSSFPEAHWRQVWSKQPAGAAERGDPPRRHGACRAARRVGGSSSLHER